ncbi:Transposon TX1 uncharacterized 149 kDa protein, partial [Acropora cervicornis]
MSVFLVGRHCPFSSACSTDCGGDCRGGGNRGFGTTPFDLTASEDNMEPLPLSWADASEPASQPAATVPCSRDVSASSPPTQSQPLYSHVMQSLPSSNDKSSLSSRSSQRPHKHISESLSNNPSFYQDLSWQWNGGFFYCPAVGRQGGVITLISKDFCGCVRFFRGVEMLMACYKINIVNIYAPTNLAERKIFFENLHGFFFTADCIALGGDFNCYESDNDKLGGNVVLAEYLSRFRSAIAFIDAWRKLHRRARSFTWFNSDHSIASRLDKFFVSKNIGDKLISASVVPFPLSDHDLINLHIDL